MEQILSNDIVAGLLRGESHARALAKRLGANHMTVGRKLKELVEENVLDFRLDGRNKVYFLKKTVEARNRTLTAEHYKLDRAIGWYPELRGIVEAVQKDPDITLAVIFGSHAKGTSRRGSDIDLYVETTDRELKKRLELLNSRLSVKIGAFDPASSLIKEIRKDHIIVKGAEVYYEKEGFFH